MKYLTNEIKKMSSFLLMLGAFTFGFGWEIGLMSLGVFLCIEHLYSYGEMTFWDFAGHEWLGLVLFIIGAHNWMIIPFTIGWLLVADFTWFNPINYIKEKLRSFKNG